MFRSDTGVLLRKRTGDPVLSGEILADLYAPSNESTDELERELAEIITAKRE
jgi:thymidine phosphorylase